jgi:hypothetical protein
MRVTILHLLREALEQATNLLELNTGISEWPTDTLQLKIAKRGVCQLADYLHEANKYRRVRAGHLPLKR